MCTDCGPLGPVHVRRQSKIDQVIAALESMDARLGRIESRQLMAQEMRLSEKCIQTSDTPPYDRCNDPYYDHAESEAAYNRRRELARCQIKALQRTLGHVETGYLSTEDGRVLDAMNLVTLPFSTKRQRKAC